jgi:hypothetical protein
MGKVLFSLASATALLAVASFSVGGDGAKGRGNLELLSRESSRRQFLFRGKLFG